MAAGRLINGHYHDHGCRGWVTEVVRDERSRPVGVTCGCGRVHQTLSDGVRRPKTPAWVSSLGRRLLKRLRTR